MKSRELKAILMIQVQLSKSKRISRQSQKRKMKICNRKIRARLCKRHLLRNRLRTMYWLKIWKSQLKLFKFQSSFIGLRSYCRLSLKKNLNLCMKWSTRNRSRIQSKWIKLKGSITKILWMSMSSIDKMQWTPPNVNGTREKRNDPDYKWSVSNVRRRKTRWWLPKRQYQENM